MKEILKQEVQKLKKQMESNVYDLKSLNLPNEKYFCSNSSCWRSPKPENIRLFKEGKTIDIYCVNCLQEYMKEQIISKIKVELINMLYEVWKEEEKGK